MTRGETKIKPRVFYTAFPNLVIYVREVTPGVGWTDVFVTDTSLPEEPKLYLSKTGRLLLNEEKRSGAAGAEGRHAPLREAPRAREVRGRHVRTDDAHYRSRERVSTRRPDEGLDGNVHRRAQERHRRAPRAEHPSAQPDHGVAEEILDSCCLLRVHAGRARTGRQQQARWPARQFRPRHRRRVRLLVPHVHLRGDRERPAASPGGSPGSRCGCRTSSWPSGAWCSSSGNCARPKGPLSDSRSHSCGGVRTSRARARLRRRQEAPGLWW